MATDIVPVKDVAQDRTLLRVGSWPTCVLVIGGQANRRVVDEPTSAVRSIADAGGYARYASGRPDADFGKRF